MSAKSVRIEIIVLTLLCSITSWRNPSNPGHKCHLENSNVVRKIVQKKFVPIMERYKSALPIDCPFHADRDLFGRRREGPELEGDPPAVVCWICGLAFRNPKELRHHYETDHAESMALHEGAVCLADYCAIMRCNVLMSNEWLTSLNNSRTSKDELSQRQEQQALQKRERQESSDDIEVELAGRLAARESLRARDEARRGACNSTELTKLQNKCQVIVRSCISNLLFSLSPKDFQEIEEDMNRAVCSFLTCEKYWEDSLVEEVRYPLGFFLAVLTMLGIGMIICYYIVWVVFDSGETCSLEERFEVYVLYSEHLVEAKAPSTITHMGEKRTRRIVPR